MLTHIYEGTVRCYKNGIAKTLLVKSEHDTFTLV